MRKRPAGGLRQAEHTRGDEGNAAVMSLVLLSVFAGFAVTQYTVTQKNLQQSDYFSTRNELRRYAESGLATGYHDLKYGITGQEGNLGTAEWDPDTGDVGEDGQAATYDEGEGDGIPTHGEPGVAASAIGPDGASLIVYVSDAAFAGGKRIVASASDGTETVTVEKIVQSTPVSVPRVAAIYVSPDIALDLKGNSFLIDGHDYNPDGTRGTDDLYGLATSHGSPAGDNEMALLAQIDSNKYDQVLGKDDEEPSLGEVDEVDIESLVSAFKSSPNQTVTSGTYSGVTWGDWNSSDMQVTVSEGDLHLSGTGTGAGVLVVDGNLTISGSFTFVGMVIVRGDIKLTGGGSGTHIWGTTIVKESVGAVDNSDLEMKGTADIFYSSAALDWLEKEFSSSASSGYEEVYYGEK